MKEMKKTVGSPVLVVLLGVFLLSLGGCGGSDNVAENGPVTNPYLSASLYGITHFDSSQSDSTPYGPPRGTFSVDPARQPISYGGPVNIITLASTNPAYMWGVGTDRVSYIRNGDDAWVETAHIDAPAYVAPGLGPISGTDHKLVGEMVFEGETSGDVDQILRSYYDENYAYRIRNGAYSVVDRDNVLYANFGPGVYAFALTDPADPSAGIRILRRIDDIRTIQGEDLPEGTTVSLFGLSMTYDGFLVVIFSNGIAVIDRNLDPATAQFVAFGADETVTNSIAVDEENGLYIASNKFMRKLVWTGTTLSEREVDGAWISAYAAPSDAVPPLVKFGTGTGSTPTLMGFGSDPDKLVVITDGEKRMKLVAFWRDQIPEGFVQKPGTASRRIAGQIQVTCGLTPQPEWIQSEQSVVVRGYGAFVVNNIPGNVATMGPVNKILDVAVMGPIFDAPSGVERFRWDAESKEWKSVWARPDVSSTSMVPVNSRSSNMALVNGYTREDGWEVTGMDWDTGETVHRTVFGKKNFGNGAYAILQYLPNGDLLFNSLVGPYRVRYDQ
jgi:hypothetical protein